MRVLVVSTPVGALGSGRGGGVEVTAMGVVAGLLGRGHGVAVLAAAGSALPPSCDGAELLSATGVGQPSWQHRPRSTSVEIPPGALLPRLWDRALGERHRFDVLLNLAYDWLPFWITPHIATPVAHLVSMGSVAAAMDEVIEAVARWRPRRLAFHTAAQAADFKLPGPPLIVGNGFDPAAYTFVSQPERVLGWAIVWGFPCGCGACGKTRPMRKPWRLPCRQARSNGGGFCQRRLFRLNWGLVRCCSTLPNGMRPLAMSWWKPWPAGFRWRPMPAAARGSWCGRG